MTTLVFYGWFYIPHSYSVVMLNTIKYFSSRAPVKLIGVNCEYHDPSWVGTEEIINFDFPIYNSFVPNEYDITFSYCYPCVNADYVFYTLENNSLEIFKNLTADCKFITPSEFCKNLAPPEIANKSTVIPHGVSDQFKDLKKNRNFNLLIMGACTPNKGMADGIVFFILLKKMDPRWKLTIKTSGFLYDSEFFIRTIIVNMLKAKVINNDDVHMLVNEVEIINEKIKESELNDFYNNYYAVISLFRAEGFNLIIREALRSGCKIIIPDCEVVKELKGDSVIKCKCTLVGTQVITDLQNAVCLFINNYLEQRQGYEGVYDWDTVNKQLSTIINN